MTAVRCRDSRTTRSPFGSCSAFRYPTAGANLHGGYPPPPEVTLICRAPYAAPSAGPRPIPAIPFRQSKGVDRVVDILVGLLGGDGDCSDYAVASSASVASCRPF